MRNSLLVYWKKWFRIPTFLDCSLVKLLNCTGVDVVVDVFVAYQRLRPRRLLHQPTRASPQGCTSVCCLGAMTFVTRRTRAAAAAALVVRLRCDRDGCYQPTRAPAE